MATWNAAFNASPAGGDNPKFGDDKIRELKTTLVDRWIKEHHFDINEGGSQPRQGLHAAGSAVAFHQASAPTQRNGVALATADAGLIWVDSTTGVWYRWSGSAWIAVTVTTAEQITSTVATGTAPLVVASTTKVSNLNVDRVDNYGVTSVGNGIRVIHGHIDDNAANQNDIFDALSAAIPNDNDEIAVSGSIATGAGVAYLIYIISRAVRVSSTVIRLYGVTFFPNSASPYAAATSTTYTNGSGTEVGSVSLAW